uniref:Uncharacterized protein n=2 Tax=Aegilops tauschii subsp. strangulata TaxID=200361 RepID=A0A452XX55_AEGTS
MSGSQRSGVRTPFQDLFQHASNQFKICLLFRFQFLLHLFTDLPLGWLDGSRDEPKKSKEQVVISRSRLLMYKKATTIHQLNFK